MAGHSRPKDGVLSHAYVPASMSLIVMAGLVPAIHVLLLWPALKTWMPGIKPGMTVERNVFQSARPGMTMGGVRQSVVTFGLLG